MNVSVDVLMAVYPKDNAEHFAVALDSMLPFADRLNATVIVADGPLIPEHAAIIEARRAALKIKLLELPQSGGLGNALNRGLALSDSDFLLRMDSDDICRPNRLARLLEELEKKPDLDIVGSWIAEFHDAPAPGDLIRKLPTEHEAIVAGMRWRSMMNHMAVMMRRSAVVAVGGYEGGRGFSEDWWLWAKLVQAGCRFGNVPEILIDARIGNGFIQRRQGWNMLKQDWKLTRMMLRSRFLPLHYAPAFFGIKIAQRLMPSSLLKLVYRCFRSAQHA